MWVIIFGVCFGFILFHCLKHLLSWLNVNSESEPEADLVDVMQDIGKLMDDFNKKP
ncbi:MAG: hypothetical protein ISP86_01725 [Shewanellaceae bacterium]|nr:hypothetical protein [Shewanellaceae bacterium]